VIHDFTWRKTNISKEMVMTNTEWLVENSDFRSKIQKLENDATHTTIAICFPQQFSGVDYSIKAHQHIKNFSLHK
jgi:hypothetical protein